MYLMIANIFIFLLGLAVGSFLNCVIYRLEKKEKTTGRSYCPKCKKQLLWYDLIPVLSFLFLKGKCRYCNKKISIQYPLVEISTALIFLLIFNFQFSIFNEFSIFQFSNLIFLFYVSCSIIIIFVYDLRYYLIPDKVLLPAIVISLLYRLFENSASFSNYLLAAFISSGFFLAIFLISGGRWMGFGDVKLTVLMGLILGFQNTLVALFLAFFLGAVISIILMALKKKSLKSEIPFGPFLIAGIFLALFWGKDIIQWYLKI